MKVLIINNLVSGYRDGAIYDFVRAFVQNGDEVVVRSTDGSLPIEPMLFDAKAFDAVVASGGDGTVSSVLYTLRNTGVPVMPFPAGTANLLSLNLMMPNEPHALASILRDGHTLDFDLGEIESSGQRRGFAMMAGAGYDAAIMETASANKKLWGQMAYFIAAGSNNDPQQSQLSIDIDGEHIETPGIGVVCVNFSKIQFDIPLTHSSQPRDGRIDVMVLKAKHATDLLPSVFAAMLDVDGNNPSRGDALDVYSGTEVHVTADPGLKIQFDGEPVEAETPFVARALKQCARIILPDEGYRLYA
jgi:diacylglycerol kinase family enzyme